MCKKMWNSTQARRDGHVPSPRSYWCFVLALLHVAVFVVLLMLAVAIFCAVWYASYVPKGRWCVVRCCRGVVQPRVPRRGSGAGEPPTVDSGVNLVLWLRTGFPHFSQSIAKPSAWRAVSKKARTYLHTAGKKKIEYITAAVESNHAKSSGCSRSTAPRRVIGPRHATNDNDTAALQTSRRDLDHPPRRKGRERVADPRRTCRRPAWTAPGRNACVTSARLATFPSGLRDVAERAAVRAARVAGAGTGARHTTNVSFGAFETEALAADAMRTARSLAAADDCRSRILIGGSTAAFRSCGGRSAATRGMPGLLERPRLRQRRPASSLASGRRRPPPTSGEPAAAGTAIASQRASTRSEEPGLDVSPPY